MVTDRTPLNRRDAIKLGLGVGAGLAFMRAPLYAEPLQSTLITKPIPSSGERLPIVGIGTARRYDVGTAEADRGPLRDVLREFPRLGGRLVDTAPSYGNAETVVGDLVGEIGNRDQLFFATKVGAGRQGRAAGIAEMEASFRKLKTDRIDLIQVHNLNAPETMLPVLREWKQAGRIRYQGVTTTSERQYEELEKLLRTEQMDFIEVDYAVDNRGVDERILPLAADRGVAVLVALPFGRGRVQQAFGSRPVPDFAKELGIETWAQFALKYVVSHPAVTVAIPGTAKMTYLNDNIRAAIAPLPDEATRQRMVRWLEQS
jgi:aryl-alcohol dehydrogenase-like predicted oxidoreductase